jgi:hypothetical protein
VIAALEQYGGLARPCRTTLSLEARAHSDVFAALSDEHDQAASPRRTGEARTYLASLCEAHVPAVNDLIQRYRLATYDYFAYEVAPWDVPVWAVVESRSNLSTIIQLLTYTLWDRRPIADQGRNGDTDAPATGFRFTDVDQLVASDPQAATPGEFDLLDARSLMERGDYTGAVRRSVTAIEAAVRHALRQCLLWRFEEPEAGERLARTDDDYPGRYRQWKKLSKAKVPSDLEKEFEVTRRLRHEIVHRARRLTHEDRGTAQRCVDTTRWLFNFIENDEQRRAVREGPRSLRDVGRTALTPRFGVSVGASGIEVVSPNDDDY